MSRIGVVLQQLRKKGTLRARACRQSQNNNRTVKKLTEEVVNEPNDSLSESDESVHQIEEI